MISTISECPVDNDCIDDLCIAQPQTTCGGVEYGTDIRSIIANFTLPLMTQRVTLIWWVNDNGRLFINNHEIVPTTQNICAVYNSNTKSYTQVHDDWSGEISIPVPLDYINLGGVNVVNITVCSCGDGVWTNLNVVYEVLPEGFSAAQAAEIINVPRGVTTLRLSSKESFVYVDQVLNRTLAVSVKDCSGEDMLTIASRIGGYERPDYKTADCDTGSRADCRLYNPYGVSTVAIVTTEEGLDLSNTKDMNCSIAEINAIKSACPNCTSALYVGQTNYTSLSAALSTMNASSPSTMQSLGLIAHSALVNNYPSCNIADIMNDKINMSKLALYNYTKPSIILDFGLKEGNNTYNNCTWNNASITEAYSDLYGLWIPMLAGSGTVGLSQYCYTDPCPKNDNYGLFTARAAEKPYTGAWFREGCGRYYYNAEGLSLTTFSLTDSNYSLCDPSRMLAVLQSAECAIGKKTLKTR